MAVASAIYDRGTERADVVVTPLKPPVPPKLPLRKEPLAPIELLRRPAPFSKSEWNIDKPGKITLEDGRVLVGGEPVPIELLRDYVDSLVTRGAIDAVVVMTSKDTPMSEVMPVVDECRLTKVRTVYIAHSDE